jgi:hypothetical protein
MPTTVGAESGVAQSPLLPKSVPFRTFLIVFGVAAIIVGATIGHAIYILRRGKVR